MTTKRRKHGLPRIDQILNQTAAWIDSGDLPEQELWPHALLQWINAHGLTSAELADRLGLSKRTVDCWRRVRGPRPRNLAVLLAGLELELGGGAECEQCKARRERFERVYRDWRKKTPQQRQKKLNRIKERENYADR